MPTFSSFVWGNGRGWVRVLWRGERCFALSSGSLMSIVLGMWFTGVVTLKSLKSRGDKSDVAMAGRLKPCGCRELDHVVWNKWRQN